MAKLLKKAARLLFVAGCVSAAHAAPLTVSSEKVVLLVNESVTSGGVVSTTARSGPLTTSSNVFSIDRLGSPSTTVPVSIPAISFSGAYATATGLPTQMLAADVANAHLSNQYASIKGSLGAYMRQYGITSGWFNFKQQVDLDVGGAAETWTIYWDFFTDANGRGAFGEAKLVPTDPKTLYVVYTPLRVSSDLPANWAFTDAGTVKYQLRDVQFQPVSDWVTINVGGVYDTLESGLEAYDGGLACLMDTANPGCTASTSDVKNLMDRTGAVLAVVDYTRRVEPVYVDNPDGSRVPQMTATISSRELNYAGCTPPTFHNVGTLSYTLSTTVARYLAGSVGSPRTIQYEQIQEFSGTSTSPGYAYDMNLQVPRRDTVDLATKAIDPVLKDRLMALADIPGLQYPIQPIQINGDPNPTIGSTSGLVWQYGGRDDAYQMTWALKCAQYDDGYELATTINSTHHWDGWHPNTPAKSPVSSTGWSSVALNDFGGSRYMAYADYGRGLVLLQDGTTSGSYSYRSSGQFEGTTGGFICAHNSYSLMGQIGTAYECNAPAPVAYACGTALHPYDHYIDGNYIEHVSQQNCTGYPWIRGLYMADGSPYYEYQEVTRSDPSVNAQYNCRVGADGVNRCAWEIREGTEPTTTCANGASDYPTCTPDPTPTCANGASDYPTCTPNPTPTCANGASDYPTCTPNPSPTCANGASDYPTCTPPSCANGASDYPTCTPPSCANGASDYPTCTPPPQLPPSNPPAQECYTDEYTDDAVCPSLSSRGADLFRRFDTVCTTNGVETSRTRFASELWAHIWCENGVVTDTQYY